jgi:hypothetical protein
MDLVGLNTGIAANELTNIGQWVPGFRFDESVARSDNVVDMAVWGPRTHPDCRTVVHTEEFLGKSPKHSDG